MKTLEEHNRDQMIMHASRLGAIANGIACPKCGNEMFDSYPNMVFTSSPPQKAVECGCGYSGYRYT